MRALRSIFLLLALALPLRFSLAAEEEKLPLPRFVSLRASEVNMRLGPGTEYEISWIYRRKNLPVEIVEEFYTWRKIRDWEGTTGWVHKNMLSGKRTAIVTMRQRILRREPAPQAKPRAFLEPGVIVTVEECRQNWCDVEVPGNIRGWIQGSEIWGVYPTEQFP